MLSVLTLGNRLREELSIQVAVALSGLIRRFSFWDGTAEDSGAREPVGLRHVEITGNHTGI